MSNMDNEEGYLAIPRPAWDCMMQVVEQAWNLVRQVDGDAAHLPVLASRLRVALTEFELHAGWGEGGSPEAGAIDNLLRQIELGGSTDLEGESG
jgi:hypothetical protein